MWVLLYRCLPLIKCGIHLRQARSTLVSLRLHNSRMLATCLDSVHCLGQIYSWDVLHEGGEWLDALATHVLHKRFFPM
jgi:hypothetical protein